MRRPIRATALGFVAAVSLGGQSPARAGSEIRIDTKDGERMALVLEAPGRPGPTVMVLHGGLGSAERIIRRSGFAEAAARHGFAAVFPQGIDRQWNDGREFRKVDDVGFLRRLAEELVDRGVTDPARLYIAGVSNGGMMTFRMLCEASDLFAGAGTIIANMPARVGEGCRPERPVPLIMFNGTADPLVPYEGGSVGFRGKLGSVWSAERTAAFLARSNGCSQQAGPKGLVDRGAGADGLEVVRLDWSDCKSRRSVTLYRVEGGGHQIFGRGSALTAVLGHGTGQISAPETIMAAFARLAKHAQENSRSVNGGPTRHAP
jgi:polyhydroxybutyrate depolymerase